MGFQTIGDARNGFLKPPRYMSISRTRHRSGGRWATIDDEVDHHTPRLVEPRSPRGQLAASQPPFEASKSVTAPIDVVLTRRVPPPLPTSLPTFTLKVAPDVGHGFGWQELRRVSAVRGGEGGGPGHPQEAARDRGGLPGPHPTLPLPRRPQAHLPTAPPHPPPGTDHARFTLSRVCRVARVCRVCRVSAR